MSLTGQQQTTVQYQEEGRKEEKIHWLVFRSSSSGGREYYYDAENRIATFTKPSGLFRGESSAEATDATTGTSAVNTAADEETTTTTTTTTRGKPRIRRTVSFQPGDDARDNGNKAIRVLIIVLIIIVCCISVVYIFFEPMQRSINSLYTLNQTKPNNTKLLEKKEVKKKKPKMKKKTHIVEHPLAKKEVKKKKKPVVVEQLTTKEVKKTKPIEQRIEPPKHIRSNHGKGRDSKRETEATKTLLKRPTKSCLVPFAHLVSPHCRRELKQIPAFNLEDLVATMM
eukprot:scaffold2413_cov44-Attheya_sp.AAC.1